MFSISSWLRPGRLYISRNLVYLLGCPFYWHISSVQFSRSVVSESLWPHEPQHTRPPCPSPTPGVHPNPRPLSWWCHPAISSSVVPFSCPQSFPASGSFPMSQLFASGGQSIGVSASVSVLPMNTQDWSPLGWTGWISLQSKGLSRVFSNTTVQKHQFFGAQLSSHPYMTIVIYNNLWFYVFYVFLCFLLYLFLFFICSEFCHTLKWNNHLFLIWLVFFFPCLVWLKVF